MEDNSPLPVLFASALDDAAKASSLATLDDEAQNLIQSSLSRFRNLTRRLEILGIFSPNETLEDVSTIDLVYMLVPPAYADVLSRVRTTKRKERLAVIGNIETQLRTFVARLTQYQVVPEDEIALYLKRGKYAITTGDGAKRREVKIKQFQKEREIRSLVDAVRTRRNPTTGSTPLDNDFTLIASLLPSSASHSTGTSNHAADDEDDDDDLVRKATLLVLRLYWTRAHSQLESLAQELELLQSAPPEEDEGEIEETDQDDTWRLDQPTSTGGPDGRGPLLDPRGKPLRPFTILPSGASQDRARLQAQVFQADHRLPTMTIDQYLEEEQRRGNFISGGGAASANAPTSSELLTIEAEQDGTVAGYEASERKREKDEKWAVFTDSHRKGEGNMMNRG